MRGLLQHDSLIVRFRLPPLDPAVGEAPQGKERNAPSPGGSGEFGVKPVPMTKDYSASAFFTPKPTVPQGPALPSSRICIRLAWI